MNLTPAEEHAAQTGWLGRHSRITKIRKIQAEALRYAAQFIVTASACPNAFTLITEFANQLDPLPEKESK